MGGDMYQGVAHAATWNLSLSTISEHHFPFRWCPAAGNRRGFRYRPGSEKRALPSRVERPFRFGRQVDV